MSAGTLVAPEPDFAPGERAPLSASARAWAFFQGGRDPWVVLIVIYIFMPYFATTVVGDPVRGQALAASASKISGWVVALTAPVLGLVLDRLGRRKPWLLLTIGLMVPLVAAQWWALPAGAGLSISNILALQIAAAILFGWSDILFNAMLIPAAGPYQAHRASGLGLALSNAFSVLVLAFVLFALVLPGQFAFLPAEPLFGLSAGNHEPERIVGPIAAAMLLIGMIPLALYTHDMPATGERLGSALRKGFGDLLALLGRLRVHRNATVFLASRVLYADALTAIFVFSGIYAAGVMRWGPAELLMMGLILSVAAAIGGLLAGRLDGWLGPRPALITESVIALVGISLQLSLSRNEVLFMLPVADRPIWASPFFATLPELLYLGCGCLTAIGIASSIASSRTLLTRLVPREELGAFFGLYGLTGTATAWLGPMLVEYATAASGSQRVGFAPIVGLLLLGLGGLFFVSGGGPLESGERGS